MTTWRDRDGDLYERDDNAPDHWCRDGQEDDHGRIIVCPRCRPGLAERLRRQRRSNAP